MRQMMLRVPEELHLRLAARAARERRSLNSLATELLDIGADADRGDARTRVAAAAAAAGSLRSPEPKPLSDAARSRILATTRGLGQRVDAQLADDRDRG
jgi:hypothetical protein